VTGAAGFIGRAASAALLDAGASVTGCDSLNDYYDPALKQARLATLQGRPGFGFARLDLAERGALAALWRDTRPQVVLHLAAQAGVRHSLADPHAYTAANIEGTLNVLEAARAMPVEHLLYASSSSVYGANGKVPFAEDDPVERPVSLYAATKRAGELMATTYAHLFAIPATGLRFFTVYGPWGRPDMAYWKFTRALFAGDTIEVYDAPRMARDFTYIDDVVEAVLRLIPAPPPGRPPHRLFNIGNHTPERLEALITTLERLTGQVARRRELPAPPGDVLMTYAEVSRLEAAVGWAPATRLADGLAAFVGWYRAFHGLSAAPGPGVAATG
jgi:UDP-glucuronate 4-epimerase